MRVIMRGDCFSHYTYTRNATLFGNNDDNSDRGPSKFFQDEKVRSDTLLLSKDNKTPQFEEIKDYYLEKFRKDPSYSSNIHYFKHQLDRNTMDINDADLIIMDNYSDMNFTAIRNLQKEYQIWIDNALIDTEVIDIFDEIPSQDLINKNTYVKKGHLTLDEALEFQIKLIEHYRNNNGNIPVLYFNQPINYFPNLEFRSDFNKLGKMLEERVENFYLGEIDESDIINDGLAALHFTPMTYRKALFSALDKGLSKYLPRADIEPRIRREYRDEETGEWDWVDYFEYDENDNLLITEQKHIAAKIANNYSLTHNSLSYKSFRSRVFHGLSSYSLVDLFKNLEIRLESANQELESVKQELESVRQELESK